jgi:hypothetical protein
VYALGFVSVFDQVLDSFDQAERAKVFDAYISALGEDPRQYRVRAAVRPRDAPHGASIWRVCRCLESTI